MKNEGMAEIMNHNQNIRYLNVTPRRLTIAEYLIQQIAALGKTFRLADMAKAMGLQDARVIRLFVASELKVPLDMVLPLARVLNVPVPILFRLAMEQFGENMTETAAELFNGPDGGVRHYTSRSRNPDRPRTKSASEPVRW
jgi:hypothetical protein